MLDGIRIMQRVHARGAAVKVLDKPHLDLTTAIGKGFLAFLSALAEGERERNYILLLQRAYAAGDLSLVYPLARGVAPLLVAVVSIAVLGEPLTLAALGQGRRGSPHCGRQIH